MKKSWMKKGARMAIGIGLFFLLGKVSIPTSVADTYISMQYAIQSVYATLFGPVMGAVIGFFGHMLIDITAGTPSWSWIIASGFVGLIIGLMTKKLVINEEISRKEIIWFNLAQLVAHLIAWGLIAPAPDLLMAQESLKTIFSQGLVAGLANIVTTGVVGTLLLYAYGKTFVREGEGENETESESV